MSRPVPAPITTAVLAVALASVAAVSAPTPARWMALAVATAALHYAYLLFVMLGALLGLRDVRWLGAHLPTVVWGLLGLAMTKRCPVTLLEKMLWEKAGRPAYDGTFMGHYVFGVVLPEGSQSLVYWVQAGLVVGVYVLAIHRWVTRRRVRGTVSPRVDVALAA